MKLILRSTPFITKDIEQLVRVEPRQIAQAHKHSKELKNSEESKSSRRPMECSCGYHLCWNNYETEEFATDIQRYPKMRIECIKYKI